MEDFGRLWEFETGKLIEELETRCDLKDYMNDLEQLVREDEWDDTLIGASPLDLINELSMRDLDGYIDDIYDLWVKVNGQELEEESDEINLDELDHSLFYMSQDDFSKLLKIVEYHKEHRNG
jgi:hypothetical protein